MRGENWWQWAILAAVAITIIWLTVITVPWHMDEFINYHPLACRAPSQKFNVYEVSCTDYATQIGPWEYHRSFKYAGAASAVLLWPFAAFLNPIVAHYVVGIIVLAIVVLGVVRSLGIQSRFVVVGVMFFPVVFAVLHDGGPVRIGLVAMTWTPVLARRFLHARGIQVFVTGGVLISLWIVATEDKPFFLYLIPGIALWTLASLAAQDPWREILARGRALTYLFVLAVAACLAFLLLANTEGKPYLVYLAELGHEFAEDRFHVGAMQALFMTFGWPFYALRVRDYSSLSWPIVTVLIVCFLYVIHLYLMPSLQLWQRRSGRQRGCVPLLFASTATMAVTIAAAGGWATHHFVYMQIPLLAILLLAVAEVRVRAFRLGAHLGFLSFVSLALMAALPQQSTASQEISVVMQSAISQSDANAVVNCADWGCYFTYSLLNIDNVPVVWADDRKQMSSLAIRARKEGFRILQVCVCQSSEVREAYPQAHVRKIATDTKVWRLFAVDVN